MSEKNEKKHPFFVDGKRFETAERQLSGTQIKQIGGVAPEYQLFLETEGDVPDKPISDGETVDMVQGKEKHFFAVPPATFGAQ